MLFKSGLVFICCLLFLVSSAFAQQQNQGEESAQEQEYKFFVSPELYLGDRASGYGVSVGYRINQNIYVAVANGRQSYENYDIFESGSRRLLHVRHETWDLLAGYEFPSPSNISFSLAGGVEQQKGQMRYLFYPFTSAEYTDQQDFENYALVAQPMLWLRMKIFGSAQCRIGAGVRMRLLRDKTFTIHASNGDTFKVDNPMPSIGLLTIAIDF